jgi:hypothetical protein
MDDNSSIEGCRMRRHRLGHLVVLASSLLAASALPAQVFVVGVKTATEDVVTDFHPTHVELPAGALDERGRLDLIRNLEAEQGFAHRELPLGAGLTLIANGNMFPRDDEYKKMLYQKGQSASPGERIEISALKFTPDAIVIDFNGGPYAKHRFLSHISINDNPIAQLGPAATGCRITLVFEGGVPEISAAEVKALLDPIVDFKAKSSLEAYSNTLPPVVREAVEAHEILVGMDRRMVMASVGAPLSRHREHVAGTDTAPASSDAPMYEEWIYGQPPQATRFVRFRAGKVVRLEIAALGKPIEIHETNEMGNIATPSLLARTILNGDVQRRDGEDTTPAKPPTLRNPGEPIDTPSGVGKVNMPPDPKHLASNP